jgi:hypothetical protein
MYEISKCEDNALWDSMLASSDYATPYCGSAYLMSTGQEKTRFILSYKQKPVLMTVLSSGADRENYREYSDYQGLIFLEPKPRNYSEDLLMLNHVKALLDFVMEDQEVLLFSLHPEIIDIRAFQWFAFDHSNEIEFNLKVRYTGIIDLVENINFQEYLPKISGSRSKEFLANSNKIIEVQDESQDIEVFIEMYQHTFSSQEIELSETRLNKVISIIESGISHGHGKLRIARTLNQEPIAGAFFLKSKTAQYYQFGASSALKSTFPGNSHLLLKAIKDGFQESHKYLDLTGINSPKRGFFKASFAARPKPFYEVTLKRIKL